MAARQPGAPSIQDTLRMRMNAETGATSTSLRYQWQMPFSTNAEKARAQNEFPIVPVPKDPYDDTANIKSVFGDGNQVGNNWVVPFDQADAQYLLRKRDAQEKAQFDAWVMQKYNIADPAQNMMLQNIAPELFQRREEVIDSQQALVSAYAKTRLRGAKSLSDLELEWLVETGRLELPKGPIWNPAAWRQVQALWHGFEGGDADASFNAHRYRFGLFSPIRWLTEAEAGWKPTTSNPADIRGDIDHKYENPNVPYPLKGWGNVWGGPTPYPGAGSNTHANMGPNNDYARRTRAVKYDSKAKGKMLPDAYPGLVPGPDGDADWADFD